MTPRFAPIPLLLLGCPGPEDAPEPPSTAACDAHRSTPTQRLTRTELGFALTDLLEQPLHPTLVRALDTLPADDITSGFEGIAGSQRVSMLHLEAYDELAAAVAARVVAREQWSIRLEAEDLAIEGGELAEFALTGSSRWWRSLGQAGLDVDVPYEVPDSGRYTLEVRAAWVAGQDTGPNPIRPTIRIQTSNDEIWPILEVPELETADVGVAAEVRLPVEKGTITLGLNIDVQNSMALDWVQLTRSGRRTATATGLVP